MVMTYYSGQLRIQSGYSKQQPITYLEKRRYFTAREKVTCHRCASFYENFLAVWETSALAYVDPGRPHLAILVVVELLIND